MVALSRLPKGLRGESITIDGLELVLLEYDAPPPRMPESLTDSESDVAARIFRGQSTHTIASERSVSPSTLANQLASIFAKLGVASRAELVVMLRALDEP